MSTNPRFDSGGGGDTGATGGGGTSEDPRDFEEEEDTDTSEPGPPGGPTVTTGTPGGQESPIDTGPEEPDPEADDGGEVIRRFDPREEDVGAVREAAERLASRSEFIDPRDIQVVQRDGRRFVRVDPETARTLGGVGFMAGDEFVVEGGRVGETGGGEDLPVARGGGTPLPRDVVMTRAEEALERKVAQSRLAATGIVNPDHRQAAGEVIRERTDLEAGDDFEVSLTSTAEGPVATVTFTEEFARAEASRQLETQLFREHGVALEAGEDFEVVETDEGGFRPELTETGEARLDTASLTRFVAGVEAQVGDVIPGEGPEARGTRTQRDFGQRDAPIPVLEPGASGPGLGAFAESTGGPSMRTGETTTLEAELEDALEGIDETVEPTRAALLSGQRQTSELGAFGEAAGIGHRELRPGEGELAQLFAEKLIEAPLTLPVGGALLAKDVLDLGAEVRGAVRRGDVDRLTELSDDLEQTAINTAAVGASRAIEEPARTAAGGLGTIAGSAFLFGGAAAAGPRASMATRALVQPGEEVLGIGGHAITRRVAGRGAAQRLFPDAEPLIFSEEAAIRAGQRAFRRGRDITSRLTVESRAFGAGPPKLRLKSKLETELEEELERMERAQAADVPLDPDVDFRGPFVNQRTGQVELKSPIETGRELEPSTTRPLFEGRVEQQPRGAVGEMQRAGTAVESLGLERLNLDLRTDLDIEGELEHEFELEAEAETEAEAEAKAELRRELEFELEGESEFEFEVEPFDEPRRRRRDPEDALDGEAFEKEFTSPVATPEEVISGLSEDVLDGS